MQVDEGLAPRFVLCAERRYAQNAWSAVGTGSMGCTEACRREQTTRDQAIAYILYQAYYQASQSITFTFKLDRQQLLNCEVESPNWILVKSKVHKAYMHPLK